MTPTPPRGGRGPAGRRDRRTGRHAVADGGRAVADGGSEGGGDGLPDGIARRVLETVPDGVLVTDVRTGEVVDANGAAGALVARPVDEVVGSPLRTVFPPAPAYDDVVAALRERADRREDRVTVRSLGDADGVEVRRPDGTTVPVELTVDTASAGGTPLLFAIIRNVSEQRGREQQLSVFTRILRHNLRNDLSVVRLYAEELAEAAGSEHDETVGELVSKTEELLALAEKARTVEQVVGGRDATAEPVDVHAVVRRVVEDVLADHPAASVDVDVAPGTEVRTVPAAFEVSVRNVVENAVEHNEGTPRAWVSCNVMADGVEVVVEDDGPGLPPDERAVLVRGEETQLEHGSGVGLWLVNWATSSAEGDVFFEDTQSGSRVTLWFPELEA